MVRGVVVASVNNDRLLSSSEGGGPFLTSVLLVKITDGVNYHRFIRHAAVLRRINKLFVEDCAGADSRERATLMDTVESVDLSGVFKQIC